jgi:hypothetical protein
VATCLLALVASAALMRVIASGFIETKGIVIVMPTAQPAFVMIGVATRPIIVVTMVKLGIQGDSAISQNHCWLMKFI